MTSTPRTADQAGATRPLGSSVRQFLRDRPLIPLLVLLLLLIALLELQSPGIVKPTWLASTIRAAIPLAILAAAQTLTMLTGGIDLSVGWVASMSAFIVATQTPEQGALGAVLLALFFSGLVGLGSGIGVGIFRVHPLIMTLGMSLVVTGFLQVYQREVVATGREIPDALLWLGSKLELIEISSDFSFRVPAGLVLFVPLAILIMWALRRWGYGRLLYAVGDNETAARLAGVRVWQVLVTLYVISALLAGVAGLVYVGLIKAASQTIAVPLLLPSVAAAVIGGTSIFGGRGGYSGTIVGALILTVLTTLLTLSGFSEAARQVLFGAIILAVTAAYTWLTEER